MILGKLWARMPTTCTCAALLSLATLASGCSSNFSLPSNFYVLAPGDVSTKNNQFTLTRLSKISPIAATVKGGGNPKFNIFSIDTSAGPALPPGLLIDPQTGEISGTPTREIAKPITVRVQVKNDSGVSSTTLSFQILARKPESISLSKALSVIDTPKNSQILAGLEGDIVPKMEPVVQGGDLDSASSDYAAPVYQVIDANDSSKDPSTWKDFPLLKQTGLTLDSVGKISGALKNTCGGYSICTSSLKLCVKNSGGFACSSPFQIQVGATLKVASGAPVPAVISGVNTIASGDTLTLAATGGMGGYAWSVPSGLSNSGPSDTSSVSLKAITPTTYRISVSDLCRLSSHQASYSLAVSSEFNFVATTFDLVSGQVLPYSISGGVGTVIPPVAGALPVALGGDPRTSGTLIAKDPTLAGSDLFQTVPLIFKDSGSPVHSKTVTLHIYPSLKVAPSTLALAIGDTATLKATGGIPPYVWSSSDSASATVDPATGVVSALKAYASLLISVKESSKLGPAAASTTVSVNDRLVVTAPATSLVSGQSVQFKVVGGVGAVTAKVTLGAATGIDPKTYLANTKDPVLVSGASFETDEITFTDSCSLSGCTALPAHSQKVSVRVYPKLLLTPLSLPFSVGDSYPVSVSGGIPPYSWTNSDSTILALNSGSTQVTALAAGDATLQVSDSAPLGVSKLTGSFKVSDAMTVSTSPALLDPSKGLYLKTGATAQLKVMGGVPAYRVAADSKVGVAPSGAQSYTITAPTASGTYSILVRDSVDSKLTAAHTIALKLQTVDVPVISAISINNPIGDPKGSEVFTSIPSLNVYLSIDTKNHPAGGVQVQLFESSPSVDCSTPSLTAPWQDWADSSKPLNFVVSALDGPKTLCAFAQGKYSLLTSAGKLAPTITFMSQFPPIIKKLTLTSSNPSNPRLTLSLSDTVTVSAQAIIDAASLAEDVLGNADQPAISIEVLSGDPSNVWQDIGSLSGSKCKLNGAGTKAADINCTFPAPLTNSPDGKAPDGKGFIQVRAVAHDIAHAASSRVYSDTLNTENWSIFAGSRDDGLGQGRKTAYLFHNWSGVAPRFAVDPKTNDVYTISDGIGVVKLDSRTGLTSLFIDEAPIGITNFPPIGTISAVSLPKNPTIATSDGEIKFDRDGLLYITHKLAAGNGRDFYEYVIYQIDLHASSGPTVRWYLGGALRRKDPTDSNDLAHYSDPNFASVASINFEFDEKNNLYFATRCNVDPTSIINAKTGLPYDPGYFYNLNYTDVPDRIVLMKANRDSSAKAVKSIEWKLGKCDSMTTPSTGASPDKIRMTSHRWRNLSPIAVRDEGRIIVWTYDSSTLFALVDGVVSSILPPKEKLIALGSYNNIQFDRSNGATQGDLIIGGMYQIQRLTIAPKSLPVAPVSLLNPPIETGRWGAGPFGPTAPQNQRGDCTKDLWDASPTAAAPACLSPSAGFEQMPDGTVLFSDGYLLNQNLTFRIRYITKDNKVQTLLGRTNFVGDGLDRSAMIGSPAGIINQTNGNGALPNGLYVIDNAAPIISRIDPLTGVLSIVAGNTNQGAPIEGQKLDTNAPLGIPYAFGQMSAMAFDSKGNLFFNPTGHLARWNQSDSSINYFMENSDHVWSDPSFKGSEVTPANFMLSVDGASSGMTLLDDSRVAFLGGWKPDGSAPAVIRIFDTASPASPGSVIDVMGFDGAARHDVYAPDSKTPLTPDGHFPRSDGGSQTLQLHDQTIDGRCGRGGNYYCSLLFNKTASGEDLYMSEYFFIRRIRMNPTYSTDGSADLVTLAKDPEGVRTMTPDYGNDFGRIFYTTVGGGHLKCVDIDPSLIEIKKKTPSIDKCYLLNGDKLEGGEVLNPFGSKTPIAAPGGQMIANSMTWLSSKELLITSWNGQILKFTVPWK